MNEEKLREMSDKLSEDLYQCRHNKTLVVHDALISIAIRQAYELGKQEAEKPTEPFKKGAD